MRDKEYRGNLPSLKRSSVVRAFQTGTGGSAIVEAFQHVLSGRAAAVRLMQTGKLSPRDRQAYQSGELARR